MTSSTGSVSPSSPPQSRTPENVPGPSNVTPSTTQIPTNAQSLQQQQTALGRGMESSIRAQAQSLKRERISPGGSPQDTTITDSPPPSSKRTHLSPEINILDAEEARDALYEFKEAVKMLCSAHGVSTDDGESDSGQSRQASANNADERWTTRLKQTKEIIEEIEETDCEGPEIYACQVDGKTIGMITLDETNPPAVSGVTHPQSKGVGRALLEKAVRASEQQGYGGRLQATAAYAQAAILLHAAGFVVDSEGGATLDPANSDKWSRNQHGELQLTERREIRYPVDFGE